MSADIAYLDPDEQAFYRHQETAYGEFAAEMMYLYNPRRWKSEMEDWKA